MNRIDRITARLKAQCSRLTISARSHQYFGMLLLAAAPVSFLFAPMSSLGQVAVFAYAAGLMCISDLSKMVKQPVMMLGFALRAVSIASVMLLEGASVLMAFILCAELAQHQAATLEKSHRSLLGIGLAGTFMLAMLMVSGAHSGQFMSAILAAAQIAMLGMAHRRHYMRLVDPAIVEKAANVNVKPLVMTQNPEAMVFACTAQGEFVAVNGSVDLPVSVKKIKTVQDLAQVFSTECQHVLRLGVLSARENRVPACAVATRLNGAKGQYAPVMVEILPVEAVPANQRLDERADVLIRIHPMGMIQGGMIQGGMIQDEIQSAKQAPVHQASAQHKGARSLLSHTTISSHGVARTARRSSIAM